MPPTRTLPSAPVTMRPSFDSSQPSRDRTPYATRPLFALPFCHPIGPSAVVVRQPHPRRQSAAAARRPPFTTGNRVSVAQGTAWHAIRPPGATLPGAGCAGRLVVTGVAALPRGSAHWPAPAGSESSTGSATGRVKVNRVPWPTPPLSARMRPGEALDSRSAPAHVPSVGGGKAYVLPGLRCDPEHAVMAAAAPTGASPNGAPAAVQHVGATHPTVQCPSPSFGSWQSPYCLYPLTLPRRERSGRLRTARGWPRP